MDVRRPVTLVRVSLLRRSSSPTGSSTGKAAEASAAQPTAESVRVAGGTAAKGRPTPQAARRRDEPSGAPAPAPPRTQREASKLAKADRPSPAKTSGNFPTRGPPVPDRLARGDDHYLLPRDRGPVKAYIRDVVDSRPHIMGLFMPLAVLVLLSVVLPFPSMQHCLSLFSLLILPRHDDRRGHLPGVVDQARRCARSSRTRTSGDSSRRLVRLHAGQSDPQKFRVPKPRVRRGAPTPEVTSFFFFFFFFFRTLVLGGTR